MINFFDTSAILDGALKNYENIYISPIVIQELEKIKTSDRNEHIKYLAREAVRDILIHPQIKYFYPDQKKINKLLKKFSFLSNINDHYLLMEALLLQHESSREVNFITSDASLYLFARKINKFSSTYYQAPKKLEKVDYCGWRRFYPTETELVSIYSAPNNNILNCKINEFAEIYEGKDLKDILFWDGNKYAHLQYKEIKNPYTGETIRPRNTEQKMAFHLLQNPNIKIKLLTASWGSGKTLLALNYALEQVYKGYFKKMVFVRNNIIAAGTNDIGFLPGDVRDKLSIFARCIADHVGGEEELDRLIDEGIIETVPLSHIRGRSIKDSIVLCDECEDMTDSLVTLLISRIEENSEIIFCGDIAQIDKQIFRDHNGIESMLKNLAGEPLFGTVKLVKSERSKVAALCDKMIPPQ